MHSSQTLQTYKAEMRHEMVKYCPAHHRYLQPWAVSCMVLYRYNQQNANYILHLQEAGGVAFIGVSYKLNMPKVWFV